MRAYQWLVMELDGLEEALVVLRAEQSEERPLGPDVAQVHSGFSHSLDQRVAVDVGTAATAATSVAQNQSSDDGWSCVVSWIAERDATHPS